MLVALTMAIHRIAINLLPGKLVEPQSLRVASSVLPHVARAEATAAPVPPSKSQGPMKKKAVLKVHITSETKMPGKGLDTEYI